MTWPMWVLGIVAVGYLLNNITLAIAAGGWLQTEPEAQDQKGLVGTILTALVPFVTFLIAMVAGAHLLWEGWRERRTKARQRLRVNQKAFAMLRLLRDHGSLAVPELVERSDGDLMQGDAYLLMGALEAGEFVQRSAVFDDELGMHRAMFSITPEGRALLKLEVPGV